MDGGLMKRQNRYFFEAFRLEKFLVVDLNYILVRLRILII